MSDEIITPWQGDWQSRLKIAVLQHGFDSLESFLDAHPASSYTALSRKLDANIAPMQLYGEQIRRAVSSNTLKFAVADCLVRFLAEYIKRGWNSGKHFKSRLASAFAAWKSTVMSFSAHDPTLDVTLDSIWSALEMQTPPDGWLPSGKSDRIIAKAMRDGWPAGQRDVTIEAVEVALTKERSQKVPGTNGTVATSSAHEMS